MIRESIGYRIFNAANIVFFLLVSATMVLPFLNVVTLSLEPDHIARETGVLHLFPREFTLKAYKLIWEYGSVRTAFANSVFVTAIAASLGIVLTGMFGYALSFEKTMLYKPVAVFVLLTMMFNVGIIPRYMLMRDLGLLDSLWSLIVYQMIGAYNVLLMRIFFKNLPESLAESATLDGASEVTIFFRIVIPISAPIIATITLFIAVGRWNSYFDAVMYLTSESKKTLQVLLREILIQTQALDDAGANDVDIGVNVRMATAVAAILPILFVYPFLQKHFAKGVLIGAIKG